ncbi:MAG: IS1182 family transposase [Flavobacterium sp.]|nr:IS1182 family transposase [Flavobacterium sp.]
MQFKPYQPNQAFLLPPSYTQFLGESHQAVILQELIQSISAKKLLKSYRNQHGGSSAYHPVMLLTILVYGYMNGIFSSRKMAKLLRQDLAFMYLAGNLTPDFRTISLFRKQKGIYIENIFKNIVNKAQQLGLISFNVCSLDGTKIYANANKQKNTTQEDLEARIRKIMDEAESIDKLEDELYGDEEDAQDPELKTKAGRLKRQQELEKKLKKEKKHLKKLVSLNSESNKIRTNLTDSDSKLMQMKHKDYANGYNVQIITENGVILSNTIFNNSADQATLIPSMDELRKNYPNPKVLLADKGYSTADNYAYCEQNGIDAYIPIYNKQVDIKDYVYDEKKDTYTNKMGQVYVFKQHMNKIKEQEQKKHERSNYKQTIYQYLDKTTNKKSYLSVNLVWQDHLQKQEEKFSTSKGKQLYKQRMHDVEGVFANIKKNLGFTSFNLRGFTGVKAEWTLISLAHNLKKVMTFS